MTARAANGLAQVIRRAAVQATKAASVHNTQPWRFSLGRTTLEVHADWSRRLQVLDPRGRQLLISCGCAVFNATVSMAAAGYAARVDRFPDPAQPTLVARLTAAGPPADVLPVGGLDAWIDARHSTRGAFTGDAFPAEQIAALIDAVSTDGVDLISISRADQRAATARLALLADGLEQEDPAYRAELRAWTSVDAGRLDGLPERLVSLDHMAGESLLLLGTRHDTRAAWLRAGEALEQALLEVTRAGYAVSPITNLIEVAATNAPLRAELELTTHPQVLLRVGRAPSTTTSRRRRLADMFKDSA